MIAQGRAQRRPGLLGYWVPGRPLFRPFRQRREGFSSGGMTRFKGVELFFFFRG